MPKSTLTLLSKGMTPHPDGEYEYYETSLLIPHETLRREMNYGLRALDHLDIIQHPWKIHCFNEWMTTFLGPSIHGHHDLEENCFFAYYKNLGVEIPEKQTSDHRTLIEYLDRTITASKQLLEMVTNDNDDQEKKVHQIQILKGNYHQLVQHMNEHLDEEDAFWPNAVQQYGEKTFRTCEKQILAYGQKHEGKNFENLLIAVLYAMGVEVDQVPHRDDDTVWAGPKTRAKLLDGLPYFPVKMLLLSGWNKRYQRYKTMITSIYGDVDILHLQDQQAAAGCSCIIA